MMEQSKMPLRLRQEVMESGNCARCGLCVGLCPYIKTLNERVAFIHDCSREDGNCYKVCPRTPTNWSDLDKQVFGKERADHGLGNSTKAQTINQYVYKVNTLSDHFV